jgi:hypothetical protein
MKTITHAPMVALALFALAVSAHAQGNGNGGGGGGAGTDTQPFQQANVTTLNSNNAINVGFNGVPSTTDGVDHNVDGTIAYINPISNIGDGTQQGNITYQTFTPAGSTVTYMKQMVTTDNAGTKVWDGTLYRVYPGNGNQTSWARQAPGISMEGLRIEQITGAAGNTAAAGVGVDGVHNDNQIIGGVVNTMANRADALDGLIKSVKDSATTIIDLSGNNYVVSGGGFGTPNNPAVVYASGKMVNGVMVENDLKFSGQENGYGILVVEIDDPNKAQFNMSGQSMWHGLIIVAINKVPTSNKQPLSFVGGGNAIHVIGGVFVYDRNIKRTATETATLLGVEMVKLAGNGNITFSDQAIDQNFKMRPTSMQVRSWRRLSESE